MGLFPRKTFYFVLIAVLAIDVCWLALGEASVRSEPLVRLLLLLAALTGAVAALAYFGPREGRAGWLTRQLSCGLQAVALLLMVFPAVKILNHLSMTTAFPLADPLLAEWDARLGFHWPAYFEYIWERPALASLLSVGYTSLTVFCIGALGILVASGQPQRIGYFLEAFLITAVVCVGIGMFFPAEAASAHYLREMVPAADLSRLPGLYHLEHLRALRVDPAIVIDPDDVPGLVTFPSFHTAAGIVLAAALRRSALFRPAVLYVAVMIASTPVFGAHYFVDLIAGGAVAATVLWALGRTPCYRGALTGREATAPAGGGLPAFARS